MSYTEIDCNISVVAGEDLSDKGSRFVTFGTSAGKVVANVTATAGERANGVVAHGTIAGQAAAITIPNGGVTMVRAGGVVAAGADVMSNDEGEAVTAATAGSVISGTAMAASTAAGDLIPVQFIYRGEVAA